MAHPSLKAAPVRSVLPARGERCRWVVEAWRVTLPVQVELRGLSDGDIALLTCLATLGEHKA